MKQLFRFFLLAVVVSVVACNKGEKLDNEAPETHISLKSINLEGEDRLNSLVHLYWYGTDPDGFVKGYEISFDQQNWQFVTIQDSLFRFSIQEGVDTADIVFYVRAIDQLELADETPAQLTIPIRNTPPTANFQDDLMPVDTVLGVVSLSWEVGDEDGLETIDSVYLKVNNGNWQAFGRNTRFLSVIGTQPGVGSTQNAKIYFGSDQAESYELEGFNVGDTNRFYLKVTDIALSESVIDTSELIFVRAVNSDLLVIGGSSSNPESFYFPILSNIYANYDYINFAQNNGEYQPKFWNPTFSLLLSLYDKVFMYTDQNYYINPQTNQEELILESASSSLQQFLENGGKAFVSALFPTDFTNSSALFQTMPMDSLSSSSGQARLPTDSLVESQFVEYPNLNPSVFITGLDPFYPTTDAEVIYQADVRPVGGWVGPKNIAARRKRNGNVYQVFFSVELNKLNGQAGTVEQLMDQVLNQDFNW